MNKGELSKFLEIIDDKNIFIEKLDKLDSKQAFILHTNFWDYVTEKSKEKNPNFMKKHITQKLEPTANYMYKNGCTYDEAYCIARLCMFTDPICATRKTKGIIYSLREILLSL